MKITIEINKCEECPWFHTYVYRKHPFTCMKNGGDGRQVVSSTIDPNCPYLRNCLNCGGNIDTEQDHPKHCIECKDKNNWTPLNKSPEKKKSSTERKTMIEPTSEQCTANEKVHETETEVSYAIWYPQMGGYGAHALITLSKNNPDRKDPDKDDPCFEAYIWHDGEFPFSNQQPARIHHCSANQFIRFGTTILSLERNNK